eukprot:TRINITY_DN49987_c0_g1_i1.p1 TRINITY_DN49987_c0_g1~~TRINITY_DN49987_c0_g1_i1.p1  ORF type:complete len:393 (+),score=70.08 TRINITY_DN49987_c0_g1_i1:135-1181(+)
MKGKTKGPSLPCGKGKGKKASEVNAEAVHTASQFDDVTTLGTLLADQTDVNCSALMRRGVAPLHTAACNGAVRAVRLLVDLRAAVNAGNHWKETPLHVAVAAGRADVMHELLGARADMEKLDNWQRSPLRVAKEVGADALARALLEAGACEASATETEDAATDLQAPPTDRLQQQALTAEFLQRVEDRGGRAFVEPKVTQMFAAPDKIPSKTCVSVTSQSMPLSKLVEYPGDPRALSRLLCDPSVDPAGRDAFGLTALHKFAAWNKTDLLELLLPHMSDADVNASDAQNGYTPLHHAIAMGAAQTTQLLLSIGRVKKDVKDKAQQTPLDLAVSTPGAEHLAALFQDGG